MSKTLTKVIEESINYIKVKDTISFQTKTDNIYFFYPDNVILPKVNELVNFGTKKNYLVKSVLYRYFTVETLDNLDNITEYAVSSRFIYGNRDEIIAEIDSYKKNSLDCYPVFAMITNGITETNLENRVYSGVSISILRSNNKNLTTMQNISNMDVLRTYEVEFKKALLKHRENFNTSANLTCSNEEIFKGTIISDFYDSINMNFTNLILKSIIN